MSARQTGRDTHRRGFALVATLWALAGAAALVTVLMLAARDAVGAAQNRVSLTRALWAADGCAAVALAAADAALAAPDSLEVRWRALDHAVEDGLVTWGSMPECELRLAPAGLALDANAVTGEQLHLALLAAGVGGPRADSLADALLDWRDGDDAPRRYGAEREWYDGTGRQRPRNGPFAATAELARVRGFEDTVTLRPLLGVEPGRLLLDRAPPAVLAALPGVGPEALAAILEWRRGLRGPVNTLVIAAGLSPQARDELLARHAELTAIATSTPDAWILEVCGRASDAGPAATVELRLVRSGAHVAVVRRRTWP